MTRHVFGREELLIRCAICDASLSDPKLNPDIGTFDPCDKCMAVVEDTLAGYNDRPAAAEDELGQYPLPLDFTPPAELS